MKLLWKAVRKVYEESYQIIAGKQEGTSSWVNLWFPGKGQPVQNDFTGLISTSMYREFFLEELVNEINYLDYSIYHLDGPDALKHLDMILEIPRLNAVQWVPGAGSLVFSRQLIQDILSFPKFSDSRILLMDIDKERLNLII